MKTKWLIIGCSTVAGIFIIVVAVGMWYAVKTAKSFTSDFAKDFANITREPEMPADLKKPRVIAGDGFVMSNTVYGHGDLKEITSIVRGNLDGAASDEIGVASPEGAAILDKDFAEKSYVRYFTPSRWVDVVDVEGDGVCEYLNRGGYGSYASLIDHNGKPLFNFADIGVFGSAYGDVDGDGKLEFAVACGGAMQSAITLFDSRGKKRWSVPEMYVSEVLMADTDGDGRPEVVYIDPYGKIVVVNAARKVVSREKPDVEFTRAISLVPWPTRSDPKRILAPSGAKLFIIGFDAKTIATVDAPGLDKEVWDCLATYVRLEKGEPDYLAVIASYDGWNRAVLYVYDHEKKLVYEEVTLGTHKSILAVLRGNAGAESLLLGSNEWLWRYDAAGKTSKAGAAGKR